MPGVRTDDLFFWKTNHENGWASQWYYAPFEATFKIGSQEEKHTLPSAEHYMMVRKALLFGDIASARSILENTGTGPGDMRYVKSIGRAVQGFKEETWISERSEIVLQGNLLKFRQSAALREKLLASGELQIVEASPNDAIWGIGLSEAKALEVGSGTWGLNLLGKALMNARRILREEQS